MTIFIEPLFREFYEANPLILVDVGASGGLPSRWQLAQKYLRIIGFEPDPREFDDLERKNNGRVRYFPTGLYKEKREISFYMTGSSNASSLYKPNVDFLKQFPECERFNIVEEKKMQVDSLDNVFKDNAIVDADFIKVDTQGSELFILEGAQNTIHNCIFGIEAEVEFAQIYQGQPLFNDVDSYLRKCGFHLFDIQKFYWKRTSGKNLHKKKGQLIFGNALYLKTPSQMQQMLSLYGGEDKKKKILKALSICFLCGYYDYAAELFHQFRELFTEKEIEAIEMFMKRQVRLSYYFPDFKGRKTLANMIFGLWKTFMPTHHNWAIFDKDLGNL